MLSVQNNLLAQNANRNLKINTGKNAKTAEKLSSGYKINRAADDASGLSISEKMRRQIRGLHQSADNIDEGVGYVQTADGALNEVHDILQRINELSVKAANGTNSPEDREYIDQEIQQLKKEMTRIFAETTFNERKIWEPTEVRLLGSELTRSVNPVSTGGTYIPTVTNDNYDVLPVYPSSSYDTDDRSFTGYFTVHAQEDEGIKISWTGYNGTEYWTNPISWTELKDNNYRFEMSDYFDLEKYPELQNDSGDYVFYHQVAFDPIEQADISEMVYCLDGRTMSATVNATMSHSWEDTGNNHFTVNNVVLNYPAAYASLKMTGDAADGHNFDDKDNEFLEPVLSVNGGMSNLTTQPTSTTAEAARNDNVGWEFTFEMKGVGTVKATATSLKYWCNDTDEIDKGHWWKYNEVWNSATHQYEEGNIKLAIVKKTDPTLQGLMAALTGTEGVLNKTLGGDNDGSTGYFEFTFELTADNAFTYGDNLTSNNVGSFTMSFNIPSSYTEQQVVDRINEALNNTTILDFATSGASADSLYFGSLSPIDHKIDAPIYGGICGFFVQAGTEGGQHISIEYESLNLIVLGMKDTNVLTQESAGNAINEVKAALQIVSKQRSDFGAYQNRLEHAYNINKNGEENTQASESIIRDADIADEMMEFSVNNILLQAGTSMLTQANQSKQLILELLN